MITIPQGMVARISIAFRWCTSEGAFPSELDSSMAIPATANVSFVGVSKPIDKLQRFVSFDDSGSWVMMSASRRSGIIDLTKIYSFIPTLFFHQSEKKKKEYLACFQLHFLCICFHRLTILFTFKDVSI